MTNDQFLVITELLSEIRDVLMMFLPDDPAESDECQHPEDQRVSFATPQQPDHWICSGCKFEHHGVIRN